MYALLYMFASHSSTVGDQMPSPSVNRTACKLRLQVRSGLRPPAAGHV